MFQLQQVNPLMPRAWTTTHAGFSELSSNSAVSSDVGPVITTMTISPATLKSATAAKAVSSRNLAHTVFGLPGKVQVIVKNRNLKRSFDMGVGIECVFGNFVEGLVADSFAVDIFTDSGGTCLVC